MPAQHIVPKIAVLGFASALTPGVRQSYRPQITLFFRAMPLIANMLNQSRSFPYSLCHPPLHRILKYLSYLETPRPRNVVTLRAQTSWGFWTLVWETEKASKQEEHLGETHWPRNPKTPHNPQTLKPKPPQSAVGRFGYCFGSWTTLNP